MQEQEQGISVFAATSELIRVAMEQNSATEGACIVTLLLPCFANNAVRGAITSDLAQDEAALLAHFSAELGRANEGSAPNSNMTSSTTTASSGLGYVAGGYLARLLVWLLSCIAPSGVGVSPHRRLRPVYIQVFAELLALYPELVLHAMSEDQRVAEGIKVLFSPAPSVSESETKVPAVPRSAQRARAHAGAAVLTRLAVLSSTPPSRAGTGRGVSHLMTQLVYPLASILVQAFRDRIFEDELQQDCSSINATAAAGACASTMKNHDCRGKDFQDDADHDQDDEDHGSDDDEEDLESLDSGSDAGSDYNVCVDDESDFRPAGESAWPTAVLNGRTVAEREWTEFGRWAPLTKTFEVYPLTGAASPVDGRTQRVGAALQSVQDNDPQAILAAVARQMQC
ncbi:unnamed protein product [Amoebophrya sp. A25]|nr:unnamed protein product [Amoebophrya sp. A25]|eukprot:GSA25T00010908001.1